MATTPLNSPLHGQERLAKFWTRYPLSKTLKIQPASWGDQGTNGGLHDGFDVDDLKGALGVTRFNLLMGSVKELFCCSHRIWPATHAELNKRNAEVYCVWAADLEAFLKAGH
jgi:hypothetical protein